MNKIQQASFSKGELAPSLYGRTDTAIYQVGLRTARNAIVHPYGGVSNRPGSYFLCPTINHSVKSRLIEFRFNNTDNYILEFSDFKMHVIRNDALVVDLTKSITAITKANPGVVTAVAHGFTTGDMVFISGVGGMSQVNGKWFTVGTTTTDTFQLKDQVDGTNVDTSSYTTYTSGGTVVRIYTAVTPYAVADLPNLRYIQSADVMTLTHPSYPIYELARLDHDNWTFTELVLGPTIDFPDVLAVTPNTTGAVTYQYKVTALDSDTGEESLPAIRAAITATATAITKANPGVVTTSATHPFVTGDKVFLQNVSGMTQVNNRVFTVGTTTSNTFQLSGENTTSYGTFTGTAIVVKFVQSITQANPAVVTFSTHGLANGDEVWFGSMIGMVELNNRRAIATNVTTNTFELTGIDSTGFTAFVSGGMRPTFVKITNGNATANNTITWAVVPDADTYVIYKFDNGAYGKIGQTAANTFLDDNIAANLSISPPRSQDPFDDGNYPAAAAYYEQRRVFGGSNDKPDTSYYSRTGQTSNFNNSFPLQADDAITAVLTSREINQIQHYIPLNDLIILTSGGEWRVNSGPDSAFSTTTIRQKPQSNWGSGRLRPIVVGSTIIYTESNLARVRSLGYSFQDDAYQSSDLSMYSNHLVEMNKIDDWSYTHAKDSRFYMARDDGQALTMTFDQVQEVLAWTRWDTDGFYEGTASLRLSDITGDAVYFIVRRKINGRYVRYIEKMASRTVDDLRDCHFVDCGLSLDIPVTVTGVVSTSSTTVTAPSHGFSNGDTVIFSDILWDEDMDDVGNAEQPDQLNNHYYLVSSATTDTFVITNMVGGAITFADFQAYVSGGFVRKCVQDLSGLDHLEGKSVTGLGDGNVIGPFTVTSGAITLPSKVGRIHIGLPYISDIETLDVTLPQQVITDRFKKLNKVTVKFEKSRALLIGPDSDHLTEIKWRTNEGVDQPTSLFTGDHTVNVSPQFKTEGRMFLRQIYPLPMSILSVVGDWTLGG